MQQPQTHEQRLLELDGIRGCAIALVLVWHYVVCQVQAVPGTALSYAIRGLALTWSGVDLFFVLSGFLIGGILLRQRESATYFSTFYVRRACRILPLYWLLLLSFVMAATAGLSDSSQHAWLFQNAMPLWSYATFTQNILMGFTNSGSAAWLAVTWSLAIEEQFYLFIPLLIRFAPLRILPGLLVAGIAGAVVLRFATGGTHAFVQTPMRADSLLMGVLLAYLVQRHRLAIRCAAPGNRWVLMAMFGVLLSAAGVMSIWNLSHTTPFLLAGLYAVFILIPLSMPGGFLAALLRLPPLRWLGLASYSIYLIHQPVAGMVHAHYRGAAPAIASIDDAVVTVLALMVTLAVSAALYLIVESPMMALGRRRKYAPHSGSPATLEAPVATTFIPPASASPGRAAADA